MKRLILLSVILTMVLSCAPKKRVEFGFISFYYGDIEVIQSGKKTKPKLKMILRSGDEVYTKEKARIDIQLNNFGVIRVNQNSEIEVEKVITEINESLKVGMDSGQILCRISKLKKGQDMDVSTPTAVVGVRGTTFMVEQNKKEKTSEVAVTSGAVEVENKKDPGTKATVKENETAKISTKDKVLNVAKGIDMNKLKELNVMEKVNIIKSSKNINIDSLKKMNLKNLKDLNIKDMKGLGDEFKSMKSLFGGSKDEKSKEPSKVDAYQQKAEDAKKKVDDAKKKAEDAKKKADDAKKKVEEGKKKAKDTLNKLGF
ncbi:MAG: FecR family protein [Spirochaetes bacterium]|nr:FecR family protein [Spirochaetota bacterium]